MLDKLKVFFGFEEADEVLQIANGGEERPIVPSRPQVIGGFKGSENSVGIVGHGDGGAAVAAQADRSAARPKSTGLPGNFPAAEIKVEEPRIYEDSLNIASYLRENKPVLVNLKHLDADTGKRLIDFVCGTAYAINGHMMKVADDIFMFTPQHVLIVDSEEKSHFEQGVQNEDSKLFLNASH